MPDEIRNETLPFSLRPGAGSETAEGLKSPAKPRQANQIPRKRSACFAITILGRRST